MLHKKVLILGIDGFCLDTISKLINLSSMKYLQKLLKVSAYGKLISVPPFNSAASWTSFATGVSPGNHGIYDFITPSALDNGFQINSSHNIKSKTLWEITSINGKKSIIINVPMTYPPYKINGIMISGTLTPFLNSSGVYPGYILEEIKKLGSYSVDIDYLQYEKNEDIKRLIQDLIKLTKDRTNIARHFMEKLNWDLFVTVFTSSDRILHYLFGYIDPDHTWFYKREAEGFRKLIVDYFNVLDECIKQLVTARPNNSILFLISDHGFGPLKKKFYMTNWLIKENLFKLDFENGKKSLKKTECFTKQHILPFTSDDGRSLDVDWNVTKAFPSAASTLGIYINTLCKEIERSCNPEVTYENIRAMILQKLSHLRDSYNGQKVFEEVLPREEVFHGKYINNAPDIFIKSRKMEYSMTSKFTKNKNIIRDTEKRSGSHREDGVIIIMGSGIKKCRLDTEVRIIDIAPTALEILKINDVTKMEGKSIYGLINNRKVSH